MALTLWGNRQTCEESGRRALLAPVQPTGEGRQPSSFSHTLLYRKAPNTQSGQSGGGVGLRWVSAIKQATSAEWSAFCEGSLHTVSCHPSRCSSSHAAGSRAVWNAAICRES